MRNVSGKSFRDYQNTHFKFNNFFNKIVPFMKYVVKYVRAEQATDDNMVHTHCMLDS